MSISRMLHQLNNTGLETSFEQRRYFGVWTATVTDNNDPEKRYRVKVKLHHLHEAEESGWIRIATPMAGGGDRGLFLLPEVQDEVLVAAIAGGDENWVVVGSLWNGSDVPIGDSMDGDNHDRWIKTRCGHLMRFNDSDEPHVEILTNGGHHIMMHDTEEHLNITDMTGGNLVHIDSKEDVITVEVNSGGTININAPDGTINMNCKEMKIVCDDEYNLEATNKDIIMEAKTGKVTAKATADMEMESVANLNAKGATINLN